MKTETGEKRDSIDFAGELVLGVAINLFAIFVIVESLRMPPRGHLGLVCYPGFVPFLTGTMLFLLSLGHNIVALRNGAHRHLRQWLKTTFEDDEIRRFLVILGSMVLYIVVLLGRVPFVAATLVFHTLIFIYLKVGHPVKIGFYALLATALVSILLPRLFEMPVP